MTKGPFLKAEIEQIHFSYNLRRRWAGANVMIAILGIFDRFSAKKLAVKKLTLKINVNGHFLAYFE
jgi:hypothetical protein